MKNFFAKKIEFKAFAIASFFTTLAFLGTMFLFWFNHYEIPLAVLVSGLIVSLSWLSLYLNSNRKKPNVSLDVFFIYIRLFLVAVLSILFAFLQIRFSIVIVSPIILIVTYLLISLSTLLAYIIKGK